MVISSVPLVPKAVTDNKHNTNEPVVVVTQRKMPRGEIEH